MKRILLALLMAASMFPALAQDYVARSGQDSMRVTAAPCALPAVQAAMAKVGLRPPYRSATEVYNGVTSAACWAGHGPLVVVFFEDGEVVQIPAEAFALEKGV